MRNIKFGAIAAAAIAGIVIPLAGCGTSGDAQACKDYWAFKSDASYGTIELANQALNKLTADASSASPKLSSVILDMARDVRTNDMSDASTLTYVIGGMCAGMGYKS